MKSAKRPGDPLLWAVLAACIVLVALTLITSQLTAPNLPTGAGRVYPRMAAPRGMSPGELLRSMGIGSLTWYACILSAPLFIVLGRRFPFTRRTWHFNLALHAATIAVLVGVTALIQFKLTYAGALRTPPFSAFLRATFMTATFPFFAVAATAHALEARSRERQRQLEAAQMKGQLAEARLAALTAQLQPHFLFNTLQGISALIPHDPKAADRMLADLSDLLREVLRRSERREVTLEEELQVLQPYLDLSKRRFGERLTVAIDAGTDARCAMVPFFILQPLVENALAHGVGQHAGPATVQINARRDGEQLELVVRDNADGGASATHQGIGLANTRARLSELYGSRHTLDAGPQSPHGFEVRIAIPYRTAA